jgi:hypothetical protein
MNALTSPSITELTTEDGPLNLLGEWLRGWFNGSLHAVGANAAVLFPAVNFAFGQSPQVQPLYQWGSDIDTTIRLVIIPRTSNTSSLDTALFSGKLATDRVLLNFYVTAKHPGAGEAQQRAQTVANLLKALLTNPDSRFPLAQKSIVVADPEPIRWITSVDGAQRIVACAAQTMYPVLYGSQPLPLDGALVSTTAGLPFAASFYQPLELIAGEYLMGGFTAAGNVDLNFATVTAFEPQTAPVTLELEVDGNLTGKQLTLLVNAAPQVEASVGLDLGGYALTTGQKCRWKIVSAPAAGGSAWRATVMLNGVTAVVPTPATIAIAAWPQFIEFFQPNALVQGDYLLGDFIAACKLAVTAARFTADTVGTDAVVIELEVDGALTGNQVVLPAGTATATLALNLTVNTGQKLRWKVVSAPVPAQTALRASVALTATPQTG